LDKSHNSKELEGRGWKGKGKGIGGREGRNEGRFEGGASEKCQAD